MIIADRLLHSHPVEGAVGAFLDHSFAGTAAEVGKELGLWGDVKDEVAGPPLAEHGVVWESTREWWQ